MTKNELQTLNNFVIFQTEEGKVNVDVLFHDKTLWLTQKRMADLFEVNIPAVSKHLKNIFETGELEEKSVISILETTAGDGKKYKTKYYNLKAITAVGYRVNSHRATEFRKWATGVLHEYIIKGFPMDDERLKQMKHFGEDYFEEMLERVREIRLSERRIYQKITDIYDNFWNSPIIPYWKTVGRFPCWKQSSKRKASMMNIRVTQDREYVSDLDRVVEKFLQEKKWKERVSEQ